MANKFTPVPLPPVAYPARWPARDLDGLFVQYAGQWPTATH